MALFFGPGEPFTLLPKLWNTSVLLEPSGRSSAAATACVSMVTSSPE